MRTRRLSFPAFCVVLAMLLVSSPVAAAMATVPLTWWTLDEHSNPVEIDSGWSVTYNA